MFDVCLMRTAALMPPVYWTAGVSTTTPARSAGRRDGWETQHGPSLSQKGKRKAKAVTSHRTPKGDQMYSQCFRNW